MTEVAATPVVAVTDCPIFCGPKKTERLGSVVAIDLGSQDMTLAVSRDNRMPRASVVVTTAARHMIRISKGGEKIESVVVYGSIADPTAHPDFREITENVRDLRNKWFAKAKLCLISEAPAALEGELKHTVGIYDRVFVRFEWGTLKSFSGLTGRKGPEMSAFVNGLSYFEHLVILARFVRGDVDNSTEAEVKAWIKKLQELKPREVLIQNSDAKIGGKKIKSAPKSRLAEIAEEVTEKTGAPATIVTGESLLG